MASNYQYIEVRTNQSHKMNEAREKRKKTVNEETNAWRGKKE